MSSQTETESIEVDLLHKSLTGIAMQLDQLQRDLLFMKQIFIEKQVKEQRRREKKEQKRAAARRQQLERQARLGYEDLVRMITVHRLHKYMPPPSLPVSARELQLLSLLALNKTDSEIAELTGLKKETVGARFCGLRKKLNVETRSGLVGLFEEFSAQRKAHNTRRCSKILAWLLHPPPGRIYYRNLEIAWQRQLGTATEFRRVGLFIPKDAFDKLLERERCVLDMKMSGATNVTIAQRMHIPQATVSSYMSRIRRRLACCIGTDAISDNDLFRHYEKYAKDS